MCVSDLLHVSKSLSMILSFQMETLYSQFPPAQQWLEARSTQPQYNRLRLVLVPTGRKRGGWTLAATGRIELLINI